MAGKIAGTDPELVRQALSRTGSTYVPAGEVTGMDRNVQNVVGTAPTPEQLQAPPPVEPNPQQAQVEAAPAANGPIGGVDPSLVQQAQAKLADPAKAEAPSRNLYDQAYSAMNDMGKAAEDQARGAQMVGEAHGQGADAQSKVYQAAIDQNNAELAKHAARQIDYEKVHKEAFDEFKRANDAFAKAPAPHDSRTSSQRLMGALAVGLGSASDAFALAGGVHTNHAENIQHQINLVVDRDIQAQREALSQKAVTAQAKMSELGVARQHFGDTMQADQFASALVKERTANQLGQIAANTTNQAMKGTILQQQAQFRAEAAKEKAAVIKGLVAKKLTGFDIAMMKQAGMSSAEIQMRISAEDGGYNRDVPTPPSVSAQPVADHRTKSNRGADTKEAMEADLPGYYRTQPDAWYTSDRTKRTSEYAIANDIFLTGTKILEKRWADVMNEKLPEADRRAALQSYNRYRLDLIAKASIKNEQGVVTNPEMVQRIETIPSPPLTNFQKGDAFVNEYLKGMSYNPLMFEHMREEQQAEAASFFMENGYSPNGGTSAPAAGPVATPKHKAPSKGKPKGFQPL